MKDFPKISHKHLEIIKNTLIKGNDVLLKFNKDDNRITILEQSAKVKAKIGVNGNAETNN